MRQLGEHIDTSVMTVTANAAGEPASYRCAYPKMRRSSVPHKPAQHSERPVHHAQPCPTPPSQPAAIAEEARIFSGTAICFDQRRRAPRPRDAGLRTGTSSSSAMRVRAVGMRDVPAAEDAQRPGPQQTTALVTDGRFSGTNNGCLSAMSRGGCRRTDRPVKDGDQSASTSTQKSSSST